MTVMACGDSPQPTYGGDFELLPRAVLGNASDGIVDYNVVIVPWQDGFAVSHASSRSQVQLFGGDGAFRGMLGTEGQGPNEFLRIRGLAKTPNDNLVVLDSGNGRVAWLTPTAEVARTAPIEWRGRPFVGGVDVFENGDLLINGGARGAELESVLFRWDGERTLWSLPETQPAFQDVLRESAIDRDGSVWMVRARHRLEIHHVSPDGVILKSFRPARPWFDDWREQAPAEPGADAHSGFWGPMAWVRDVFVQDDELWVLGTTGDARWRESRSGERQDVGLFMDSILDVYDKHSGELIAHGRFDLESEYLIAFLGPGQVVGRRVGELLDHLVVREIRRR